MQREILGRHSFGAEALNMAYTVDENDNPMQRNEARRTGI